MVKKMGLGVGHPLPPELAEEVKFHKHRPLGKHALKMHKFHEPEHPEPHPHEHLGPKILHHPPKHPHPPDEKWPIKYRDFNSSRAKKEKVIGRAVGSVIISIAITAALGYALNYLNFTWPVILPVLAPIFVGLSTLSYMVLSEKEEE